MCVPEKIHTHPMEGHRKFLALGGGVLKAKILEAEYEAKLEFLEGVGGGGCKTKKASCGEYGYFLGLHNTDCQQMVTTGTHTRTSAH